MIHERKSWVLRIPLKLDKILYKPHDLRYFYSLEDLSSMTLQAHELNDLQVKKTLLGV